MLTKDQIITKLKEHYSFFVKKIGLKRIALFGSYALGTQNAQSDIDIFAELEKPIGLKFIEFAEYLEFLLGRKADVITSAGLKSIRNPSIAKSIEETLEYV